MRRILAFTAALRDRPVLSAAAAALVVAVTGAALFANGLDAPFTSDDVFVTLENHQAYDLGNVPRYFVHDVDWLTPAGATGDDDPESRYGLYRPLLITTYTLDAVLSGEAPCGWRLTNLALHLLCALLLLALATRLLRSRLAGFVAAMVFVAHPIHTEAVATLIGGRSGMLSCAMVLAGALAFFGGPRPTWPRTIASAGFFALGLFAKEDAVVLPAVLLLVGWGWRAQPLRRLAPHLAVHAAVLVGYAILRLTVVGRLESADWSVAFGDASTGEIILIVAWVMASYLRLIAIPYPLQLQNCYRYEALASSPAAGICGALLVATLLGLAAWRLTRARHDAQPSVWAGCVLLFYLCLFPVAHVVPFFVIMAERFLYLPSVAWAFLLGWLATRAHGHRRWLPLAIGLPLFALYGAGVLARNADWRDLDQLWGKTAACAPDSHRPLSLRGTARLRQGKPSEALPLLREAAQRAPWDPAAQYNLGVAEQQLGDQAAAEVAYRAALRLEPDHGPSLNNLGVMLEGRGDLDGAFALFERAVRSAPSHPASLVNLGNVEQKLGHLAEAERHFRLAAAAAPRLSEPRYNLARLLARTGRGAEAAKLYRAILADEPAHAMAHNNLANLLVAGERRAEARAHYAAALQADPACAPAHYNLGNLLMTDRAYAAAAAHYTRAAQLEPANVEPLIGLGYARLQLEERPAAQAAAERAAQLAPDDPRVARLLALLADADG